MEKLDYHLKKYAMFSLHALYIPERLGVLNSWLSIPTGKRGSKKWNRALSLGKIARHILSLSVEDATAFIMAWQKMVKDTPKLKTIRRKGFDNMVANQ